jgi:hypothetical protein
MRDVVSLIVQFAATIAVSAWVVRRDLERLAPELLSRAWPESSFWSAVVCFSPICVPLHFVRTRRSALGVALGIVWFFATMVAVNGLGWVVDAAMGG